MTVAFNSEPSVALVMAHDLRRTAKSGSDWGTNELYANRISIVEQEQDTFFGGPLPTYGGPAGFLQHEELVKGLDNSSLALIKRLDQVMYGKAGDESAVGDFAVELLRAMGYEGGDGCRLAKENTTHYVRGASLREDGRLCPEYRP